MGDGHADLVRTDEFERYCLQMADYQRAQNGSIARIETGVNELRRELGEVHKTQLEIVDNLLATIDGEVGHRRADDHTLTERLNDVDTLAKGTERRLSVLELYFKLPSWSWKAIFGLVTFLGVLFTILALTHVI